MGIQGLIPFMEKASRQTNISQFKGCCVAIDAYCWLHKGAYTCAEKLARGEPCDAYVHYCMKFVNMLLSHNIKPILVFDGRHLPAKSGTEKKRRESRDSSRKRAAELLRAGRSDEARNFLRRCVDVTHEMALNLIQECRRRNVDCIVAPYEADAQLAYLNIKNIAQIVITEDSDLVLFGCSKILFKMDLTGNGVMVEADRLHLAMGVRPGDFKFDKFRYMCILSGCDYLPSLPGIGLSKACKFITRSSDPDIHKSLTRLPMFLNMRSLSMTTEYRDEFLRADATFRYQLVYDPLVRKQATLTPTPDNYKPADYTGKPLPSDTAYQLALGNLDPFTLKAMDHFNPDNPQPTQGGKTTGWQQSPRASHTSIWDKDFKIRPVAPLLDPRQVDRPTTKGKVMKIENVSQVQILKTTVTSELDTSLTNGELASLYTSAKKPRLENLEPEDIVAAVMETTPVKQAPHTETVMSPIIGKTRRNPFAKKTLITPKKEERVVEMLTVKTETKFSALAKFGRARRTSGDGSVVQSRYFGKSEATCTVFDEVKISQKSVMNISDAIPTTTTPENDEVIFKTRKLESRSPIGREYVTRDGRKVISPEKESIFKVLDDEEETGDIQSPKNAGDCNSKDTSIEELFEEINASSECKNSLYSPSKAEIDEKNNECLSIGKVVNENCAVKSTAIRNSINSSQKNTVKTFKWGSLNDRFGFSTTKSTLINITCAASKDYKNPFKKKENCPDISSEHQLLVDEEDVDDPSPLGDSGFETLQPQNSSDNNLPLVIVDEDCPAVDEGFCSLTPPLHDRVELKPCRQLGLSKSRSLNMKKSILPKQQQSLLSMFGFRGNVAKIQRK